MRLIYALFGFILAMVCTGFAVMNDQMIDLRWNPLSAPVSVPLYAVVLGMGAFGFILGALLVWLKEMPLHFSHYRQKKRIGKLEEKLESVKIERDSERDSTFFPSLPGRNIL